MSDNSFAAPWHQEGTTISKADGDSLDRLLDFNEKHNRKKSMHRFFLYTLIGYAFYTIIKYFLYTPFAFGNSAFFEMLFSNKHIARDLFLGAVLYFTSKFTFDLKEKAKEEYHSLRNEIVDLSNKEWVKKYDDKTNQEIYEYVKKHDIKINHKTK
ncbi:DUF2663 family protein [Bacillus timonensis]|uniref:DUF2663 family protein n=1 Tax=Bacillus timonensis TaxID=1033734 RepID=A0A4S3PJ36_9BACI|nr:DUF2663 family protein [Bacillus timonensis]THE09420.1 DUF2663 family protein [Bacillus timonensis]